MKLRKGKKGSSPSPPPRPPLLEAFQEAALANFAPAKEEVDLDSINGNTDSKSNGFDDSNNQRGRRPDLKRQLISNLQQSIKKLNVDNQRDEQLEQSGDGAIKRRSLKIKRDKSPTRGGRMTVSKGHDDAAPTNKQPPGLKLLANKPRGGENKKQIKTKQSDLGRTSSQLDSTQDSRTDNRPVLMEKLSNLRDISPKKNNDDNSVSSNSTGTSRKRGERDRSKSPFRPPGGGPRMRSPLRLESLNESFGSSSIDISNNSRKTNKSIDYSNDSHNMNSSIGGSFRSTGGSRTRSPSRLESLNESFGSNSMDFSNNSHNTNHGTFRSPGGGPRIRSPLRLESLNESFGSNSIDTSNNSHNTNHGTFRSPSGGSRIRSPLRLRSLNESFGSNSIDNSNNSHNTDRGIFRSTGGGSRIRSPLRLRSLNESFGSNSIDTSSNSNKTNRSIDGSNNSRNKNRSTTNQKASSSPKRTRQHSSPRSGRRRNSIDRGLYDKGSLIKKTTSRTQTTIEYRLESHLVATSFDESDEESQRKKREGRNVVKEFILEHHKRVTDDVANKWRTIMRHKRSGETKGRMGIEEEDIGDQVKQWKEFMGHRGDKDSHTNIQHQCFQSDSIMERSQEQRSLDLHSRSDPLSDLLNSDDESKATNGPSISNVSRTSGKATKRNDRESKRKQGLAQHRKKVNDFLVSHRKKFTTDMTKQWRKIVKSNGPGPPASSEKEESTGEQSPDAMSDNFSVGDNDKTRQISNLSNNSRVQLAEASNNDKESKTTSDVKKRHPAPITTEKTQHQRSDIKNFISQDCKKVVENDGKEEKHKPPKNRKETGMEEEDIGDQVKQWKKFMKNRERNPTQLDKCSQSDKTMEKLLENTGDGRSYDLNVSSDPLAYLLSNNSNGEEQNDPNRDNTRGCITKDNKNDEASTKTADLQASQEQTGKATRQSQNRFQNFIREHREKVARHVARRKLAKQQAKETMGIEEEDIGDQVKQWKTFMEHRGDADDSDQTPSLQESTQSDSAMEKPPKGVAQALYFHTKSEPLSHLSSCHEDQNDLFNSGSQLTGCEGSISKSVQQKKMPEQLRTGKRRVNTFQEDFRKKVSKDVVNKWKNIVNHKRPKQQELGEEKMDAENEWSKSDTCEGPNNQKNSRREQQTKGRKISDQDTKGEELDHPRPHGTADNCTPQIVNVKGRGLIHEIRKDDKGTAAADVVKKWKMLVKRKQARRTETKGGIEDSKKNENKQTNNLLQEEEEDWTFYRDYTEALSSSASLNLASEDESSSSISSVSIPPRRSRTRNRRSRSYSSPDDLEKGSSHSETNVLLVPFPHTMNKQKESSKLDHSSDELMQRPVSTRKHEDEKSVSLQSSKDCFQNGTSLEGRKVKRPPRKTCQGAVLPSNKDKEKKTTGRKLLLRSHSSDDVASRSSHKSQKFIAKQEGQKKNGLVTSSESREGGKVDDCHKSKQDFVDGSTATIIVSSVGTQNQTHHNADSDCQNSALSQPLEPKKKTNTRLIRRHSTTDLFPSKAMVFDGFANSKTGQDESANDDESFLQGLIFFAPSQAIEIQEFINTNKNKNNSNKHDGESGPKSGKNNKVDPSRKNNDNIVGDTLLSLGLQDEPGLDMEDMPTTGVDLMIPVP